MCNKESRMYEELIEERLRKGEKINKFLIVVCPLITIYSLFSSSYWIALIFTALTISSYFELKQDKEKARKKLKEYFLKRHSEDDGIELTVETKTSQPKYERTQSDDIQKLDLPSSEKIKHVVIQSMPISDGDTIFSERQHKKYIIEVMPQAKNCFEYDSAKKITVFVVSGSKEEAFDSLSNKLSGRYSSTDDNSNIAESGHWYNGNKYTLKILNFEKYTK